MKLHFRIISFLATQLHRNHFELVFLLTFWVGKSWYKDVIVITFTFHSFLIGKISIQFFLNLGTNPTIGQQAMEMQKINFANDVEGEKKLHSCNQCSYSSKKSSHLKSGPRWWEIFCLQTLWFFLQTRWTSQEAHDGSFRGKAFQLPSMQLFLCNS